MSWLVISHAQPDIFASSLAVLSEITRCHKKTLDYLRIWNAQGINQTLENTLTVVSKAVNDDIVKPPQGISNISEWCKRDACWTRLLSQIDEIEKLLPEEFWNELLSAEDGASEEKSARKTQKIDNSIEAQKRVFSITADQWKRVHSRLIGKATPVVERDRSSQHCYADAEENSHRETVFGSA